jgi:ABC-type uncharacterized transport system substrate-binding protein
MRRRELITLIGAAAAWPLASRAQQQAMPVIGFIHSASPEPFTRMVAAFQKGLNNSGYVEGQNVAIEFRWAKGQFDRLPALAADLVDRHVAVIFAGGGIASVQATKTATTRIPIVFAIAADPVRAGLVDSLNRPGANITGVGRIATELGAKRLELLRELVPTAAMALLLNPNNPNADAQLKDVQDAGRALGLQLQILNVSREHDFEPAFASLVQRNIGALVVGNDPFFNSRREQLVALAARHSIPAIYALREYVEAGGLISYGTSITDSYYKAGIYVARVLKGEKPADLPVEQSTKFELVINLKTAKALGLKVPLTLQVGADEVIE